MSRKKYSEGFKKEAVELVVVHGQTASKAAKTLGVSINTLARWKQAMPPKNAILLPLSMTPDEQTELKQLREENQQLKMEREILKKAVTFFVIEAKVA